MCEFCNMKAGQPMTRMQAARLAAGARRNLAVAIAAALEKAGVLPEDFMDPEEFVGLMDDLGESHFIAKAVALDLVDAIVERQDGDDHNGVFGTRLVPRITPNPNHSLS